MGTINDKNGRDLVDAEEIKKRWKEYMEEWYKIDPHQPDFYSGVASHPEPNILESKVEGALEALLLIKLVDVKELQLFKTRKDDPIKVVHSLCQQIWKTQQWPQDWKMSILIPIPKKGSTKECANHWTISLISHATWMASPT